MNLNVISRPVDINLAKSLQKKLNLSAFSCESIYYKTKGVPIIFLHGLSYTKEIWQNIGITQLMMQKNISFLALDMPYGMRSHCKPKTRNTKKNTEFLKEAITTALESKEAPILVGASIGGNMALQYASQFPVKGLLLIGPARTLEPTLAASYSSFKFPTLIIWGSDDRIVSEEDMRTLTSILPNSKLIIYQGSGHSAYKDKPDRFKQDLTELYIKVEQT